VSNSTIRSVAVATRPAEIEIELRGSRPHIGKSFVAEIIRRALADHGLKATVISQDGDSEMFQARSEDELRDAAAGIGYNTAPTITILDNNVRTQGSK
jgi:hypothetical protein